MIILKVLDDGRWVVGHCIVSRLSLTLHQYNRAPSMVVYLFAGVVAAAVQGAFPDRKVFSHEWERRHLRRSNKMHMHFREEYIQKDRNTSKFRYEEAKLNARFEKVVCSNDKETSILTVGGSFRVGEAVEESGVSSTFADSDFASSSGPLPLFLCSAATWSSASSWSPSSSL